MVEKYEKYTECNSFRIVLDYLPPLCRHAISQQQKERRIDDNSVSEIRVRVGRQTVIRALGEYIPCAYIMSIDDIRCTVRALCSGAVYAYQNTIRNGYIPLPMGGRAGVVGIISDENTAVAPETVTSINIRIPHHIRGICSAVYSLFLQNRKGIVIYSPPAVGKTTLLRDLAIELSRGTDALNVALIDSRRELDNGKIPSDCMIDIFSGYPKSLGIEIAVRTMSSDVIICDEVGHEEVEAMRNTVVSSVPVIAAAHARDLNELCSRPDISALITAGVLEYAVGLVREKGEERFEFTTDKLR